MLNRIGKSRHPCLFLIIRGEVFDLSLLNMMIAVGFPKIEEVSFYS